LHSRRIIGWALGKTLESSLVTEALEHAFGCRSVSLDELMIHADQGSPLTGKEFQKHLVDKEITCSMSRKGNCWDNAVVESFFAILKDELEVLDGLIRGPEQLLGLSIELWQPQTSGSSIANTRTGYLDKCASTLQIVASPCTQCF